MVHRLDLPEKFCFVGVAVASPQLTSNGKKRLFTLHQSDSPPVGAQEALDSTQDPAVGQKNSQESITWMLSAVIQSSAQSKLEQLLLAEQWDAALLLAKSHRLDSDQVVR